MDSKILKIATFLRQVDAYCARLNSGLSAVTAVLAVAVLATRIVRASELSSHWIDGYSLAPDQMIPSGLPFFNAWTYDHPKL